MEYGKLIACICEGAAEETIINLLLDNNLLQFRREDLLDGKPLRGRGAQKFEREHLRFEFDYKITVLRILDSRRENFKLSKAYEHKVDVINIITAPEIEMLIILNEGKYTDYKKSGVKPSIFCKSELGFSDVKSKEFIKSYFSNISKLVAAIHEYRRVSKVAHGEYSLSDILN